MPWKSLEKPGSSNAREAVSLVTVMQSQECGLYEGLRERWRPRSSREEEICVSKSFKIKMKLAKWTMAKCCSTTASICVLVLESQMKKDLD